MGKDYSPPQVLIVVKGGVCAEVYSTDPLEVLILDSDEHPDTDFETVMSGLSGEFTPQSLADVTRL